MLLTMGIHQLNFRRYVTYFPGLPFFSVGVIVIIQLGEQRYGGSDNRFFMRWWKRGLQQFAVFDNRFSLVTYISVNICYIFLFAIREWWDCPRFIMAWVLLFGCPNVDYICTRTWPISNNSETKTAHFISYWGVRQDCAHSFFSRKWEALCFNALID
jgi:hypothetical protein